jgi:methyl-accepting chemotaxis protein
VDQVDQVAHSVSQANAKVTQVAQQGVARVKQTTEGMDTIRARSIAAADKVREMSSRSKEIGRIVEAIDDIADKTDMLALNAAVEAARAGEHGRGFAVVAEQVRKLSEDSKGATRDIAGLIERVQESVHEAITAMEGAITEVSKGTHLTRDTANSLEEILQAAEEAATMAEQISGTVTQLRQKSENVVTAIETVSAVVEENTAVAEEMSANTEEVMQAMEGVASVAEENSASAEEVSASAEEMSAQVEEVVTSAQELSLLAEQLRIAVVQFRLDETHSLQAGRSAGQQVFPFYLGARQQSPQTIPAPADHQGNGASAERQFGGNQWKNS